MAQALVGSRLFAARIRKPCAEIQLRQFEKPMALTILPQLSTSLLK